MGVEGSVGGGNAMTRKRMNGGGKIRDLYPEYTPLFEVYVPTSPDYKPIWLIGLHALLRNRVRRRWWALWGWASPGWSGPTCSGGCRGDFQCMPWDFYQRWFWTSRSRAVAVMTFCQANNCRSHGNWQLININMFSISWLPCIAYKPLMQPFGTSTFLKSISQLI